MSSDRSGWAAVKQAETGDETKVTVYIKKEIINDRGGFKRELLRQIIWRSLS